MKISFRLFFILLFSANQISAQEYLFPLNRDVNTRIGALLNKDTSGLHSSIQPLIVPELNSIANTNSVLSADLKDCAFYKTWVGRKLRKEHFLAVDADDIMLSVDPVFNVSIGRDLKNERNVYTNTRGALVMGNMKDKFYFYTGFHENQARYLSYIDSLVRKDTVVPGQGKVKFLGNETFDFSQATGGVGYRAGKHFDFLLANDKNFIGDGYRSLLLSDNTYSYPFLRIHMSFWKFRYSVYYMVLQNMRGGYDDNIGYTKKYSTMHYLDANIGKKNSLTVGIFEAVMWKPAASRGYELHYLNPVIFLRPVENAVGSPDNALLGANIRWKLNSGNTIYGQLMLDEFLLAEVRAGKGWWGNKQAFQLGYKSWNLFGVKQFNLQTEFNFVRPFTYAHRSNAQDYTNSNQPLAHPLGSNFIESVSFINYRWKNIFAELKVQYAKMGRDTGNVNLGNDIFKSYDTRSLTREYGNRMFQGLSGTLNSIEFRLNYLVNPKTNFNIELGAGTRSLKNDKSNDQSMFVFFGLRTALENYYFDF